MHIERGMRHCRESRVGRTAERGTCDAVQREGCMTLCRERGGTYCQERHCRNRGGTLQREGWDTAERFSSKQREKSGPLQRKSGTLQRKRSGTQLRVGDVAEREKWDTAERVRTLQRKRSGTQLRVGDCRERVVRHLSRMLHNPQKNCAIYRNKKAQYCANTHFFVQIIALAANNLQRRFCCAINNTNFVRLQLSYIKNNN